MSGVGKFQLNGNASAVYDVIPAGSANSGWTSGGLDWDYIDVYGDGRAGKGTLTIAVNGVTVKTYTIVFYGGVASIKAAANYNVLAADAANTSVATISAYDANGTLVPYLAAGTFSATVSTATVLTSSTGFSEDSNVTAVYGGSGNYLADVTTSPVATSGNTATVTYKYTNALGTVFSASPISVSIGGSVKTVKLAFDKASYAPGEKATVTVTTSDSAGNPAKGTPTVFAAGALTSNSASQGLPNAADVDVLINGKKTFTVYAPASTGTWTISGLDVNGNAVSASATVAAADIAAAQAAISTLQTSVAALQTTVASLVASLTAQIKVINSALAKIAKKLKVKI